MPSPLASWKPVAWTIMPFSLPWPSVKWRRELQERYREDGSNVVGNGPGNEMMRGNKQTDDSRE